MAWQLASTVYDRVDPVALPRLVHGDLPAAEGLSGLEVVGEQVPFVGPADVGVEGEDEEVGDVAQRVGQGHDAPVEEADPAAVGEQVAEVEVAVDDRHRGVGPQPPYDLGRLDVPLGAGHVGVTQTVAVLVDAPSQEAGGEVGRALVAVGGRRRGPARER